VLADGGYSNGEHLHKCEQQGITATVPRRNIPGSSAEFQKSHFTYESEQDQLRCPASEVLRYKGPDERCKIHVYGRSGCNSCPLQPRCTTSDKRTVTRHFCEGAYARSEARPKADPSLMHRRMSIAERPFAVLKHLLSFRRFSCRGIQGAKTGMSIAVLAYNLKQMISNGSPSPRGHQLSGPVTSRTYKE
jgi:DDE family transposase